MSDFLSDSYYSHSPKPVENVSSKPHSGGGQQQQYVGETESQQQTQKDKGDSKKNDDFKAFELMRLPTNQRFKDCGCPRTRKCNCL